jgi:hypothetical protein
MKIILECSICEITKKPKDLHPITKPHLVRHSSIQQFICNNINTNDSKYGVHHVPPHRSSL